MTLSLSLIDSALLWAIWVHLAQNDDLNRYMQARAKLPHCGRAFEETVPLPEAGARITAYLAHEARCFSCAYARKFYRTRDAWLPIPAPSLFSVLMTDIEGEKDAA